MNIFESTYDFHSASSINRLPRCLILFCVCFAERISRKREIPQLTLCPLRLFQERQMKIIRNQVLMF